MLLSGLTMYMHCCLHPSEVGLDCCGLRQQSCIEFCHCNCFVRSSRSQAVVHIIICRIGIHVYHLVKEFILKAKEQRIVSQSPF